MGGFLRALARGPKKGGQQVYLNPYFTSSQKSDASGQTTVTFNATLDLSTAAYSGRYQDQDGDPVTRRQELVVAGVAALLVLVAATLLLIRPAREATAQARADRATAASESQALRDQIKALEALKPNEAELPDKANQAKAEFPATPALPGLVDAVQDAASLAGVELASVAPTAPKASTANPQLAEITTTVNVSGGYFEIQDFLVRLENLVKGSDPGRVPPPVGPGPVGRPDQATPRPTATRPRPRTARPRPTSSRATSNCSCSSWRSPAARRARRRRRPPRPARARR